MTTSTTSRSWMREVLSEALMEHKDSLGVLEAEGGGVGLYIRLIAYTHRN